MNNQQFFEAPLQPFNYIEARVEDHMWHRLQYGHLRNYSHQYRNNQILNAFDIEHENTHRYELTITFNPKFYCNIPDMEVECETIYEKIMIKIFSFLNMDEMAYFNIVKEYQKNGAPHIHGTFLFNKRMMNPTLTNWEQFFTRLYGKSTIYYTGKYDKIHKNDHFNGTWTNYLKKDNPENYQEFELWKHNG